MKKVLVITCSEERNVADVVKHLKEDNVPFVRFDTDKFANDYKSTFSINKSGFNWNINGKNKGIKSNNIKSVWYRRPALPLAPDTPENYRDFVEDELKKTLRSMWNIMHKKVLWVNDPHDLKLVELDKPNQLNTAVNVGLSVPNTLITNNPQEAVKFSENHNDLAIKTMGSKRAHVDEETIYRDFTRRISADDLQKFKDHIKITPVMIQEYIPKEIELRITIVGSKIFACAIHSQDSERTRIDWRRYDFEKVKHEKFNLPSEIKSKLLDFMKELNLQFGAIDMILTPEGEYTFLEINPSGQWGWIQALTKMPINQEIAKLLSNPELAL